MCLNAAKELCRSYQIKRLRKQRNIEVIWSHYFCNIRFLQPLFDKGSVAVACRQQLDTIKSWCIWMNQLPSHFLPAVHDGICSQLQPCQSSESSSGSGLYQRDITGLRQINALWKSNGARPPLCLGRAHDFQLALLTIICLPLNIGTTRTNQPQYGTLSADVCGVYLPVHRAERHAIGQRLPCSLDGSCIMPHPVALESFRIPVLSPILNAIAHFYSIPKETQREIPGLPSAFFSPFWFAQPQSVLSLEASAWKSRSQHCSAKYPSYCAPMEFWTCGLLAATNSSASATQQAWFSSCCSVSSGEKSLEIFGVQQSKPLKRHKLLRRVNYRGWLLPMHLMHLCAPFNRGYHQNFHAFGILRIVGTSPWTLQVLISIAHSRIASHYITLQGNPFDVVSDTTLFLNDRIVESCCKESSSIPLATTNLKRSKKGIWRIYEALVFSGFSWGYLIIPNRLINLWGKTI